MEGLAAVLRGELPRLGGEVSLAAKFFLPPEGLAAEAWWLGNALPARRETSLGFKFATPLAGVSAA